MSDCGDKVEQSLKCCFHDLWVRSGSGLFGFGLVRVCSGSIWFGVSGSGSFVPLSPALAGVTGLCSWAKHFTLTVLLSTQEYKWVDTSG